MTKWHSIGTAPIPRRSAFGLFCYCTGLIAGGLVVILASAAVLRMVL